MDSSLEFQGQKDCWVNLWQSRTGRDSNSDQIRPYILDVCILISSLKSVKKKSVERGLIGRKILQKLLSGKTAIIKNPLWYETSAFDLSQAERPSFDTDNGNI